MGYVVYFDGRVIDRSETDWSERFFAYAARSPSDADVLRGGR